MTKVFWTLTAAILMTFSWAPAPWAKVSSGQMAPDFTLTGHDGKSYSLSDFKGQHVVLEWYNQDCPYVKKHYNAGRMQDLQKKFKEQDVVWLMVVSSPEGRQGYMTAEEAGEVLKKQKASPTALLFDSDSATAQSYGALTTPHMYLINPAGQVVYQGAIDDKPSTRPSTLEGATPFLAHAVQASLQGEAIDPADTKPYGCAIKYKN